MSCGACCAFFRVSFYWGEAQSAGGRVPDNLTEQVSPTRSCMRGTNDRSPRCVALLGDVGSGVRCTIYENRPAPCHDFRINGEQGLPNPDCDRARAAYGLAPVEFYPLVSPETEIA
ncbi:YkgJ family cysteine cluster protein [Haliea sp. E17]|uniref:YkgJ family cysteine cluster protein n=1 Tax=Haliea sp. E17 TaxID=3401576 RepID=UPI003AAD4965